MSVDQGSEKSGKKQSSSGIGKRRAAAKVDRAPNYEKRRKEISEAAARVFNRRGFRGTTISAVAEELSIDRASLYYYISSKEELFDELVREVSEDNVAMARKIQSSKQAPPVKLRELIVELMRAYARSYPLLYIYIRENLGDVADKRSSWAQYMKQINRDYDNAVISIIEEGYRDGSFQNVGSAKIVAYGIIGMVGWTNRWFNPDHGSVDADEVARIYADMVISGMRTLPAKKNGSTVSAGARAGSRKAAPAKKTTRGKD
jgi:TetR/AcrR family transcriptional regulator, cholesterol catabolism regulator